MDKQQEEIMQTIVNKSKEKYRRFLEIMNLTEELEKTLQYNDSNSTSMIMRMRGTEMEAIDVIDKEVAYLFHILDASLRRQFKHLPENQAVSNDMILQYHDIQTKLKRVVQKSMEIDRRISTKIAGKDSFYTK